MAREWTKKAEKKYGWSYGGLDEYMKDVWYSIWKKYGIGSADRAIAPLEWWIKTGRATLPECKALIRKKPYVIGRILCQSKSEDGLMVYTMNYDEAIEMIKQKISK